MNYIVDAESYDSLMQWAKDNHGIINNIDLFHSFFEAKSHITLQKMIEMKKDIEAYVKYGSDRIKVELKSDKKQLFKFFIVPTKSEEFEFNISISNDIVITENIMETAEIVSRIVLIINAFMLYGNIVDYDDRKLSG